MKTSTKTATKTTSAPVQIAKFDDNLPATVSADVSQDNPKKIWQIELEEGLVQCELGLSTSEQGEKLLRRSFGELKAGKLDMPFEEYENERRAYAIKVLKRMPRYKSMDDKGVNAAFASMMNNAYDMPLSKMIPVSVKPDAVRKSEAREAIAEKAKVLIADKTPEELQEALTKSALAQIKPDLKPEQKKELKVETDAIKEAIKLKADATKKANGEIRKALVTSIKEFASDAETTIAHLQEVKDFIDTLV